uniref:Uncharacterized protein n=1 Tax=Plectus sambesii TaxID=2011161 RepID=A0A914VJX7_9BILA
MADSGRSTASKKALPDGLMLEVDDCGETSTVPPPPYRCSEHTTSSNWHRLLPFVGDTPPPSAGSTTNAIDDDPGRSLLLPLLPPPLLRRQLEHERDVATIDTRTMGNSGPFVVAGTTESAGDELIIPCWPRANERASDRALRRSPRPAAPRQHGQPYRQQPKRATQTNEERERKRESETERSGGGVLVSADGDGRRRGWRASPTDTRGARRPTDLIVYDHQQHIPESIRHKLAGRDRIVASAGEPDRPIRSSPFFAQ